MLFKKNPEIVAAVDLGSNSFHMTVARVQNGQLRVVDVLKEMVRLEAGITADRGIEPQTAARSLSCLERFSQRLSTLHPDNVRVIGTNALRRARNAGTFIEDAEKTLGYPIEIISGREEARLVFAGVSYCEAGLDRQTLVVDIGGGSTEMIIGQRFSPMLLESLRLGCVGTSLRFFSDGKITDKRLQQAILAARQELEPIEKMYRQLGWTKALGSSGSIRSIADAIDAQGWGSAITLQTLNKLRHHLIDAGHIDNLQLPAVSSERAAVFSGGFAVLYAVFEALRIDTLSISQCALREGILWELIGAGDHEAIHVRTVKNLCERYQIDRKHAASVKKTGAALFEEVKTAWQLDIGDNASVLSWAAQLHETGLAISHSGYHRHGGYLIEHSDLPGFNRQQQIEVATLVRLHRRKLRKEYLEAIDKKRLPSLLKLGILLRLAVLLHRGRDDQLLPAFTVTVEDDSIRLKFPVDWLATHPLTGADLEQEAGYLATAGYRLSFE